MDTPCRAILPQENAFPTKTHVQSFLSAILSTSKQSPLSSSRNTLTQGFSYIWSNAENATTYNQLTFGMSSSTLQLENPSLTHDTISHQVSSSKNSQ